MKEKDPINIAFGQRVAELRHKAKLSQEELAYRCSLNRTYIGTIERGEKSATIVTITKIADALNISLPKLFTYTYTQLVNSDVVCLFISAAYLVSKSCQKEMDKALEMHDQLGALVIPIIISPCAWLEYDGLSRLLAATKDAKPISQYADCEAAWYEVYLNLKMSIERYVKIKDVRFSDKHHDFLNSIEILSKTHGNKENLVLDDVLIYPFFTYTDENVSVSNIQSDKAISEFKIGDRLQIVGEEQSGKTTIAKLYVRGLKKKGLLPILIKDEQGVIQGNFELKLEKSFKEQYDSNYTLTDFEDRLIVPIIDDFHHANANKIEDYIKVLNKYGSSIIIVDDIFDMDLKYDAVITNYTKYRIKKLSASMRVELIKKWLNVSENNVPNREIPNDLFEKVDEFKRMIDRQIEHGIMPSYPFFILFLLSSFETAEKPMDKDITTQGYCYQTLIYFFLRKQNVKNEDVETYLNFLTCLSYAIFLNKDELPIDKYNAFVDNYRKIYNLTISHNELLTKLLKCNIISVSSSNYYNFSYPYLYYFFAGKYFAEHADENDEENREVIANMDNVISNLHKTDNSYIAVFIAHHTKNKKIIQKIENTACSLFSKYKPASLSSEELSFFNINALKTAVLPADNNNPEQNRKLALKIEDDTEEYRRQQENRADEMTDELSLQLRSSIKTVEVLGQIMRNRAGSMPKVDLIRICNESIEVHLRMLSSFFDIVKTLITIDGELKFLVDKIVKEKPEMSEAKAKEIAPLYFWNTNLAVVIGIVNRISFSLGSTNLMNVFNEVCDSKNTIAYSVIKHNTAMWIQKHINHENLELIMDDANPIVKRLMGHLVANYCSMHYLKPKDMDRLVSRGFKKQCLLPKNK